MWSPRFLLVGLCSGVVLAAVAVMATSALLDVFFGHHSTIAHPSSLNLMLVGIGTYPGCWIFLIQRARNYSIKQTLFLVLATYGASCLAVLLIFYVVSAISVLHPQQPQPAGMTSLSFLIAMPIYEALFVFVGAVLTAVPFAIVATPIAFLHRWTLQRMFSAGASGVFSG